MQGAVVTVWWLMQIKNCYAFTFLIDGKRARRIISHVYCEILRSWATAREEFPIFSIANINICLMHSFFVRENRNIFKLLKGYQSTGSAIFYRKKENQSRFCFPNVQLYLPLNALFLSRNSVIIFIAPGWRQHNQYYQPLHSKFLPRFMAFLSL